MPRICNIAEFMKATKNGRYELFKMGVKSTYGEYVLYSRGNNSVNKFTKECNGLILDSAHNVRMWPAPSLKTKFDKVEVECLDNYDIYEADDGTTFNLYYGDVWTISTAHCYKMNDMKWDGCADNALTFQQIVEECLREYDLTWDSFTEYLNKNCCYTFGFRHSAIQKFVENAAKAVENAAKAVENAAKAVENAAKAVENAAKAVENAAKTIIADKPRMWFIQYVCLEQGDDYLRPFNSMEIPIPPQKRVTNVSHIDELIARADAAYDEYLSDKRKVCYGFVLRPRDNAGASTDSADSADSLFIESSLMRAIRNILYSKHINRYCVEHKYPRELVVTMAAFLDQRVNQQFNELFPQYSDLYNEISIVVGKIAKFIVHNGSKAADEPVYEIDDKYLCVAVELKQDFYKKCVASQVKVLTAYDEKIKQAKLADETAQKLLDESRNIKYKLVNDFLYDLARLDILITCFV